MSLCLSVSLSLCLSVYPSLCLSVSVCLWLCLPLWFYLFLSLSVSLFFMILFRRCLLYFIFSWQQRSVVGIANYSTGGTRNKFFDFKFQKINFSFLENQTKTVRAFTRVSIGQSLIIKSTNTLNV
jgi:hypothetical protein